MFLAFPTVSKRDPLPRDSSIEIHSIDGETYSTAKRNALSGRISICIRNIWRNNGVAGVRKRFRGLYPGISSQRRISGERRGPSSSLKNSTSYNYVERARDTVRWIVALFSSKSHCAWLRIGLIFKRCLCKPTTPPLSVFFCFVKRSEECRCEKTCLLVVVCNLRMHHAATVKRKRKLLLFSSFSLFFLLFLLCFSSSFYRAFKSSFTKRTLSIFSLQLS